MAEAVERQEVLTRSESSVSIEETAKGPRISVKAYHEDAMTAAGIALKVYADTLAKLGGGA